MATYSTVKNISDSPLAVDSAGRVLGAGEFGSADVSRQPAKGHAEDGRIVVVDKPIGADVQLDDDAEAAFARTAELNADSDADSSSAAGDDAPQDDAVADTTTPRTGRRQRSTTEA